jgi:RND family efflux transporter MFP subunit
MTERKKDPLQPETAVDAEPDASPARGRIRITTVSIASAVPLLVILAIGYVPRKFHAKEAEVAAAERRSAIPTVATYLVRPGDPRTPLTLPGNVEPITEAVIYARIDGYVERRLVDIGDRVHTGQLLAVVSSPETDQELQASREALAQSRSDYANAKAGTETSKANLFIADVTNKRWQDLVARDVVSQEEADQTQSTYMAREADLRAAGAKQNAAQDAIRVNEARVARLQQLVSYEQVIAPFPGIVTARNVDIGSLVSEGSNSSIPVLYKLAKIDRMRIFVDVPQADSEYIHVGQTCNIDVRELPGRTFTATVTRFAKAIDVGSRTMRTEVQLENPKGELLPGMYAEVRFDLQRTKPPILIPANTLVASPSGDQVVVVQNGVAHFKPVEVTQDYGAEVELGSGVAIGDSLVANVNDSIRDDGKVEVTSHIQLSPSPPVGRAH